MTRRGCVPALVAAVAVGAPAQAAPPSKPPRLLELRCVPAKAARCAAGPAVPRGLPVVLRGQRLYAGMRVTFRWPRGAVATTLARNRRAWVARVPASVRVGTVWVSVRDRAHRRSRSRRLTVLEATTPPAPDAPAPAGVVPAAFRGGGMWIWELARTEGGDLQAIARRAKASGMTTVFVKSADGTNVWSQFSPGMVSTLQAAGLRVCGWQYMYGASPTAEARAAAAAKASGADCFVMDPETEYQGRYGAAQRYMDELRALVGEDFPIALTTFPYVQYHPDLPYSVFLGPGAAQVNAPQVYWKTIGGGVRTVSETTFVDNRIYGAPIAPLGQSYDAPRAEEITRFRQLWAAWGAPGISWWSWQSTTDGTWPSLGGPLAGGEPVVDPGWPVLARRAEGDQVIWLQQHLASANAGVDIDGIFGPETEAALRELQAARGLPVTGMTDEATWLAVLSLPVRAVDWIARGPASARSAARSAASDVTRDEFRGERPRAAGRSR